LPVRTKRPDRHVTEHQTDVSPAQVYDDDKNKIDFV